MITPLLSRDELDRQGLTRLVDHLVTGGVAGLFVLGTTGEGPSLSYRLRYELVERTCEAVAGRVPVLVGISDTSLIESLELAKFSRSTGAAAVVATPPYYFPVEQGPIHTFLNRLADESQLPMFLYNMPSCVKASLAIDTVEKLTSHDNIIGLKDSSGDIEYYKNALKLRELRPDWTFLMGPEHLMAESVIAGGDGGVNGGANLIPQLFVNLYRATVESDEESRTNLQNELNSLGRIYNVGGGGMASYLSGLKCAVSLTGICSGYLAEPFSAFGSDAKKTLAGLLDEMGYLPAKVGS